MKLADQLTDLIIDEFGGQKEAGHVVFPSHREELLAPIKRVF